MSQLVRRFFLAAGVLLYYAGLDRLVIWLNRKTPRILLYHACEDVESDFIRGLNSNTTPAHFALHLDYLKERYQVISLERLEAGLVPERAVVITFDDGYRSVREQAFPLLLARRFPATVYLVTQVVDNEQLVWVNALNWLLHRRHNEAFELSRTMLAVPANCQTATEAVLYVQTHYDRTAIASALLAMFHACGIEPAQLAKEAGLYLTWNDVREMERSGITFGSHTASHPNLSCLDGPAQRVELLEALGTIDSIGGRRSLAYPFGEYNSDSRKVAMELGHSSVMHVGGTNRPLDLMALARVPGTARSRAQLFAEMEVATPAMGWLKKRLGRR